MISIEDVEKRLADAITTKKSIGTRKGERSTFSHKGIIQYCTVTISTCKLLVAYMKAFPPETIKKKLAEKGYKDE